MYISILLCFQNGDVCISILHPPVDDPQSGELPSERWNPTQTVRYHIAMCILQSQDQKQIYGRADTHTYQSLTNPVVRG